MPFPKSWRSGQTDAVSNNEIQLAIRPFLGVAGELRDRRIEVGFKPIFAVTGKSMTTGAVPIEVALCGFQIFRGRTKWIGLRVGVAADPVGVM
jgi:hypothetical protein